MIQASKNSPQTLQKVVHPVIQNNGYFAHPENLLLSMCLDERKQIRELAFRRILESRTIKTQDKKKSGIRNFIIPKLNFDASDYSDLIVWSKQKLFLPPLLRNVSNEEISSLIESEEIPHWDFW